MQQREGFGSRVGFVLLSAGCAIGLGNIYRFPIVTAESGGAFFVLIYLAALLLLGLPVMTAELAVGRASKRSIATAFDVLERPRQKWHWVKWIGIVGNYLLMMCYTPVVGWILIYLGKYLDGSILSFSTDAELQAVFDGVTKDSFGTLAATFALIAICFWICSVGLQNGVERVIKGMMPALFGLMIGLAGYALTLDGAEAGLRFYLLPSAERIREIGIGNVISAAMRQAFFTLSVGIGSLTVFGSYLDRSRRLAGEAMTVILLDTAVALMAGLILFPACFTERGGVGEYAGSVGTGFLFTTMASVFHAMPGGRVVGALFFGLLLFAAASTVIAVFENMISFWTENSALSRRASALLNTVLLFVLSLPAVLSNSLFGKVRLFGLSLMDLEDQAVTKIFLPLGCICYLLFCTTRAGWGWENYLSEVNCGKRGMRFPTRTRWYMAYMLPVLILLVTVLSFLE